MSTKEIKRKSHAVGDHCSGKQRSIIEICNPQIEEDRKEAIAMCRMANGNILAKVSEKTSIEVKPGRDLAEAVAIWKLCHEGCVY